MSNFGFFSSIGAGMITDTSGQIWAFGVTQDFGLCTFNLTGTCAVYTKWNGASWDPATRLSVGGSFNQNDSVLDAFLASNGYPCVAWNQDDGVLPVRETLWKCWNGATWDPTQVIFDPLTSWAQFDVDSSGDVWMAHRGIIAPGVATQVWNGAIWTPLPKANTTCPDADAGNPDIVIDGSDTPWVVFHCINGGSDSDVLSATWNGSSWDSEQTISSTDGKQDSFYTGSLNLDSSGNPFVIWSAEMLSILDFDMFWSRWNGSAWTTEATIGAQDIYEDRISSVARDSSGNIGATWTCPDGPTFSVDVEICYSFWNGSVWSPVEIVNTDDASGDHSPRITFDSMDNPWIAWIPNTVPSLFTRWLPNYSPTVSPTWTPTFTATPTPTQSTTWTPTHTPSHTPTHSPSWTTTPTSTWTPTFTKTYTESNTQTFTPTWTFTPTPSATFTWSGTITYSGTITPTSTTTLTYTPTPTYEDDAFFLDRNAFNPGEGERVNIIAAAAVGGRYDLNVYNSAGELIRHLVKKDVSETGIIRADWDGKNDQGDVVSSGVYLIHVEAPKFARVRRIAVIR